MIKFTYNDLPSLPGADRRPVNVVDRSKFKDTGVTFTTFGINKGDVIEFPAYEDVIMVEQPIREGSNRMQYLASVLRNGKLSYIAMGSLARQDVNREYTCEFTKLMGELGDNDRRLQYLAGKKITCNDTKTIKIQAFDRTTGEPLDGKTREVNAPIITVMS